jgi:hypothetical protein
VIVNEDPTLSSTNVPPPVPNNVQTETVAPVKPRRVPPPVTETVAEADPNADEDTTTADEEPPQHIDRTWRPGRGRRSVSWRAELAGTRTVALRAGGSQLALTRALRRNFPNIRFQAYADVVIKYDQRTSSGSVSKGGRVLFASEASTPEEFARELADIFNGE